MTSSSASVVQKKWETVASDASIAKTVAALAANGIEAFVVKDGAEATKKALELVPAGSEVLTAASVTLDEIGLEKHINASGSYDGLKPRFMAMNRETEARQMRKLGSGPDVVVGSAHALTETGSVLAASLTGSQLPAYAYGAGSLVWVIGAQKIVKDVDEGLKRIYDHVVPLESIRARKAYGLPDSFNSYPAKILILNREIQPGRVKVIIVKEAIGF
jgi:L-lactate utilization protein LutC